MVTSNCVGALRCLQRRHARYFWVDAICIDQSVLSEKAVQIPLMGEIYSRAERVVIWLGEPTPSSDQALLYLNEIVCQLSNMPENLHALSMAAFLDDDAVKMVRSIRSQFQEENKKIFGREGTAESSMLSDIFMRPWFSRLWTLQELVMANSEAVFVCGTMGLLWGHMVLAMTTLMLFEQKHSASSIVAENETKLYDQMKVYQFLRQHLHSHLRSHATIAGVEDAFWKQDTLGNVMIHARHLQSSDPRDKMYGLYAYLQARGLLDLPAVSYTKSTPDVYTEYTQSIMLHDQSLELLAALGNNERLSDLPSWCPDWSMNATTAKMHVDQFTATKFSVVEMKFHSRRLLLKGVVVDTVMKRAESYMPPTNAMANRKVDPAEAVANIKQRVQTWQEWVRIICSRHRCDGFISVLAINDFRNVILHEGKIGALNSQRLDPEILAQAKESMIILMISDWHARLAPDSMKTFDNLVNFAIARPATSSIYWTNDDERDRIITVPEWRILMALNYGHAASLQRWIFALTYGKTIFTTEQGRLGTGTEAIRDGDLIVLLKGLNVPMVVRATEAGCYQLIGPAYVGGLMYGEWWPVDESSLLVFEFV